MGSVFIRFQAPQFHSNFTGSWGLSCLASRFAWCRKPEVLRGVEIFSSLKMFVDVGHCLIGVVILISILEFFTVKIEPPITIWLSSLVLGFAGFAGIEVNSPLALFKWVQTVVQRCLSNWDWFCMDACDLRVLRWTMSLLPGSRFWFPVVSRATRLILFGECWWCWESGCSHLLGDTTSTVSGSCSSALHVDEWRMSSFYYLSIIEMLKFVICAILWEKNVACLLLT